MLACHFLTLSTDNCVYGYIYQVGMITVSKEIKDAVKKENLTITVGFPINIKYC